MIAVCVVVSLLAALSTLVASFTAVEAAAFADLPTLRDDFLGAVCGPVPLLIAIEADVVHGWSAARAPRRAGPAARPSALIRTCVLNH